MFSSVTFLVVVSAGLISISRIFALYDYYHASLAVYNHFEESELPNLLNDTGLLILLPVNVNERDRPSPDLTPIKELNLTLCLGKEWHRFPGHYLVPNGVKVDFVKSNFAGLLPAHFETSSGAWWDKKGSRLTPGGLNDLNTEVQGFYVRTRSVCVH